MVMLANTNQDLHRVPGTGSRLRHGAAGARGRAGRLLGGTAAAWPWGLDPRDGGLRGGGGEEGGVLASLPAGRERCRTRGTPGPDRGEGRRDAGRSAEWRSGSLIHRNIRTIGRKGS